MKPIELTDEQIKAHVKALNTLTETAAEVCAKLREAFRPHVGKEVTLCANGFGSNFYNEFVAETCNNALGMISRGGRVIVYYEFMRNEVPMVIHMLGFKSGVMSVEVYVYKICSIRRDIIIGHVENGRLVRIADDPIDTQMKSVTYIREKIYDFNRALSILEYENADCIRWRGSK